MKDISVIIINYNTAEYTIQCVSSVLDHTSGDINTEIIIIDNNSEPEDFKTLKQGLPNRKNLFLHRSIINTGFSGGNMLGTQFANAKYLLFLNNDAFLKNDCLSILYNYMETHPNVGVATAQNYDEDNRLVSSFDHDKGIRKLLFGRSFLEKTNSERYPKRKSTYDNPVAVNFVNGAFMFFKTEAFSKVGGFDTNLFLYFEEMDICFRLRRANYSSVLIPEAKIVHHQGASTGTSKVISKEGLLSYMYVLKKNHSFFKYNLIRWYFGLTFLLKPRKWFLLPLIIRNVPLSESLKQQQKLRF